MTLLFLLELPLAVSMFVSNKVPKTTRLVADMEIARQAGLLGSAGRTLHGYPLRMLTLLSNRTEIEGTVEALGRTAELSSGIDFLFPTSYPPLTLQDDISLQETDVTLFENQE